MASASREAIVRGQFSQLKSFIVRKSYFFISYRHSGDSEINILQSFNSFLINAHDRSLAKGLKTVPPIPQ
jgi:hypothetical protein